MHGSQWTDILVQSLISAAVQGLHHALSKFNEENEDPTLPTKVITADEAEDLIGRAELLIDRLKQTPGYVNTPNR